MYFEYVCNCVREMPGLDKGDGGGSRRGGCYRTQAQSQEVQGSKLCNQVAHVRYSQDESNIRLTLVRNRRIPTWLKDCEHDIRHDTFIEDRGNLDKEQSVRRKEASDHSVLLRGDCTRSGDR